jgi:predicted ATPase
VLATSREPLRAEGEWRHRLAPLEFPCDAINLSANEALQYSALQLLSERVSAAADDYTIADGDIPAMVKICRRLDGVPLALELAAGRIAVLGSKGLAERLNDCFALLVQGHRNALPRHQTLRAVFDWSYALLTKAQQEILRRLVVFRGGFTMEAACAAAADGDLTSGDIVQGIANLVDKSFIAADVSGNVTYYRLPEMARSYALQLLQGSSECEQASRLHTSYYRELFEHTRSGMVVRSNAASAAD